MPTALRLLLLSPVIAFTFLSAAQSTSVMQPVLDPPVVPVNLDTALTITALITDTPDHKLITGSVTVLTVSPSGTQLAVVGVLNDRGINGDTDAGDQIYSGTIFIRESAATPLRLRVSAAYTGLLKRVLSPAATLHVVTPGTPPSVHPPDTGAIVTDPASGHPILCNQLLVHLTAGVPASRLAPLLTGLGGVIIGSLPSLNVYQVQFPTCSLTALAAAQQSLSQQEEIEYVETNGFGRLAAHSGLLSNDPLYQWGLSNTRTDQAWNWIANSLHRDVRGTKIGIVDTGINYDHNDLLGHVQLATDWCGSRAYLGGPCVSDSFPNDEWGHGTIVAGVAGAVANNGIGVAGVAYNTMLVAEKIAFPKSMFGLKPELLDEAVLAQGILDVVAKGAKVVNLSWTASCKQVIVKAIESAWAAGRVVVAAVGNEGEPDTPCPAGLRRPAPSMEGVIAVAASTESDGRWADSNYGTLIDLYAPGSNIVGLAHDNTSGYVLTGTPLLGDGTSFAAPFVSGAAALMLRLNPNLTPADVRSIVTQTARCPVGKVDPAGNQICILDTFGAVRASYNRSLPTSGLPTAGFVMSSGGTLANEGQVLSMVVSAGGTVDVTFDGRTRSTGLNGATIANWQWAIEGKPANTDATFSRSFGKGNYIITLIVTDSRGAQSQAVSATVSVGELSNQPPTAGFLMSAQGKSATQGQTLNLTVAPVAPGGLQVVEFSGLPPRSSDPDGTISSYEWKSNGTRIPNSTFTGGVMQFGLGVGTHTITLVVTDNREALSPVATGTIVVAELPKGTVSVNATLDGSAYVGIVACAFVDSPRSVSVSSVPFSDATLPPGTYNLGCAGGPPNSSLAGIVPDSTQTLTANGTLTFTINFASNAPVSLWPMPGQNAQWQSLSPLIGPASPPANPTWTFTADTGPDPAIGNGAVSKEGNIYFAVYNLYAFKPDGTSFTSPVLWSSIVGASAPGPIPCDLPPPMCDMFGSQRYASPFLTGPAVDDRNGLVYIGVRNFTTQGWDLYRFDKQLQSKVVVATGSGTIGPLTIGSEGTVYFTNEGTIRSVGSNTWSAGGCGYRGIVGLALGDNGSVYGTCDPGADYVGGGGLYRFDGSTGNQTAYATYGRGSTPPMIDKQGNVYAGRQAFGGAIFTGSYDVWNQALQHVSGSWMDYTTGRASLFPDGSTIRWGYSFQNEVVLSARGNYYWDRELLPPQTEHFTTAPTVDTASKIYIGSNLAIYCLKNTDGSTIWRFSTTGPVTTQPIIGLGGTVYFGTGDGKLYAFAP